MRGIAREWHRCTLNDPAWPDSLDHQHTNTPVPLRFSCEAVPEPSSQTNPHCPTGPGISNPKDYPTGLVQRWGELGNNETGGPFAKVGALAYIQACWPVRALFVLLVPTPGKMRKQPTDSPPPLPTTTRS